MLKVSETWADHTILLSIHGKSDTLLNEQLQSIFYSTHQGTRMLPVIQEQLLLIKAMQGGCQTLLCLSLGYLAGEVLLTLPGKALIPSNAPPPTQPNFAPGPKVLTGRRAGLLIALIMACNLLLLKIAYRTALFTNPFWGGVTLLFIIGLALILAARQHLKGTQPAGRLSLAAAIIGDLLLLSICYFLLNTESLLLTPESWPFLTTRPALLLSWHGTVRFAQFILLALMLAGLDRQHNRQILIFGAALTWPLFQILELLLAPELAHSPWLYLGAALTLATSAALALMTIKPLLQKRPQALTPPLLAIIVLTTLWVLGAQTARENSLTDVALAGLQLPAAAIQTTKPSAPQPATEPKVLPTVDGGQLFQQKCSVCHRFDQPLIGPALNSVLDKYRSDKDSLSGFLRNPPKIDPNYPAMPNLGLSEQEAGAITEYLLTENTDQPGQR
ncbi:c-type cytochrome [Syntrophotalea acetylenivorans]|uniref:c-type cytochrome n=1 Tax=Syntrophotalea acetylenivorans TaxID=1842532 RepID=UPI000ABBD4C4|nr:cytochrome c [Syntrophotalea acetylenivorans]